MKNKIIIRHNYLQQIHPFIDKPIIKVITGMRRVGKSYFVKQIVEEIKKQGVNESNILYINKELLEFDFIQNYNDLNNHVKEHFTNVDGVKYIFIDEIQEISSWEKAISSFFAENDFDIYITGSNAHLLSSEIATLIAGRYIEFSIFSLSFNEFLDFRKSDLGNTQTEFVEYMKYGGLPVIHSFGYNQELTYQYINSLYNTILLKDIIRKYNIRNVGLFESITKFIFSNIGSVFSNRAIMKYLKSQHISVGLDTIQNYINYLLSTYIIFKVRRFDLKGKKILEMYEKYYLGDIGLKNAIVGYKESDIAGVLENIVFLKLKQENYNVFIGKFLDYEIDFIAEKNGKRLYFQVTYLLNSEKTIEREFGVLKRVKDNYPKYVLSMDNLPNTDNDGIIRMHIIDFLMNFD